MSRRKIPTLPQAPVPAPTAEELAQRERYLQRLEALEKNITDGNLMRVQQLVQLALRRQVPSELLWHLSILGRDWYKLADYGPEKPSFQVIDGGAA